MKRIPREAPPWLIWVALAAAGAMTLKLVHELSFFQDTWAFLIERRHLTTDALLQPHNEHIVVIPVLIEQALLRIFGMTSALPEYVLFTGSLLAVAYLLYVYVKRRLGSWFGLFAAVLVLGLGPAWEVLLWPFEIGFTGSMLFGLAMLLALEREDRVGDRWACLFLLASLGFSSLGLPFVVAGAVAVLQGPREQRRHRAYAIAIPLLLFAAWYVGWGHNAESHMSVRNVLASPRYVAEAVAIALGNVFGLGTNPVGNLTDPVWGRALLIAVVAFFAYWIWRKPNVYRGFWPVAAAAATNWFLTAFNEFPGREPIASRYQYAGAIFILMLLANLMRDFRLDRRAIVIGAAVTALAVAPNLVVLKNGKDVLAQQTVFTRADTKAIEIAERTVDPDFELTPEIAGTPSLINIYAGKYLEAVEEFGSPSYSEAELAAGSEEGRHAADLILSQALPLSTITHPGTVGSSAGENCVTVAPGGRPVSEVAIGAGLTRIEVPPGPPAQFALRRFAVGEYPVPTEGAPGDSTTVLRIPRDTSQRPWRLLVTAKQGARVCR